jgi:hypothetical protein
MQARRVSSRLFHAAPRLLVAAVAAAAASIGAQQTSLGVSSGVSASPFRYQIGRHITYVCPAVTPSPAVAVWGIDPYTWDSSVCLAAIHAGVLRAQQAGPVTFVMGPGAAAFAGSTRNGVTSGSYTGYDSSFTFDRSGEPGRIDGMTTMRVPEGFSAPVTVVCPPLGTFPQALWGTDIYAEDSSICAAAAHSGLIALNSGGPVTVTPAGPQQTFAPSQRNGVTSQSYTQWPTSFRVAAVPAIASRTGTATILTEAPASARNPTVTPTPTTVIGQALPTSILGNSTVVGTVAPAAAKPPRYRIMLTGFACAKPTVDDPRDNDGRADEVFAVGGFVVFDRNDFRVLERGMIRTREYGDVGDGQFKDRIQAGGRSSQGGIWSGDRVPAEFSPTGDSFPASMLDRFPLRVWEGTLNAGTEAVVVVPSLWEVDGPATAWDNYLANWQSSPPLSMLNLPAVQNQFANSAIVSAVEPQDVGLFVASTLASVFTAGLVGNFSVGALMFASRLDRPIGLQPAGNATNYQDRFSLVTQEKVASLQPGAGINVAIPFAEGATGALDGIYTLYLRVERVE